MKRLIIVLLLCFVTIIGYGQKSIRYQTKNIHNELVLFTDTGEVYQQQDDGQYWQCGGEIEPNGDKPNRFKLYSTQNMWTFIEIDTFTGRLWQVQYTVDRNGSRFVIPISLKSLLIDGELKDGELPNGFILYPTENMWTFIELDTYTGRLWQVQYDVSGDDRFILPINEWLIDYNGEPIFYVNPTRSMYQFYLDNGNSGERYQFQWSTKGADYRWIKKIR